MVAINFMFINRGCNQQLPATTFRNVDLLSIAKVKGSAITLIFCAHWASYLPPSSKIEPENEINLTSSKWSLKFHGIPLLQPLVTKVQNTIKHDKIIFQIRCPRPETAGLPPPPSCWLQPWRIVKCYLTIFSWVALCLWCGNEMVEQAFSVPSVLIAMCRDSVESDNAGLWQTQYLTHTCAPVVSKSWIGLVIFNINRIQIQRLEYIKM